jgi:[ribosomal protein S5]-alanine N-acetyltransferase
MTEILTPRLAIRRMRPDDAAFVYTLLNDAAWLQYIGDRGVRSIDAARAYIEATYIPHYERHGFGLYLVVLRETAIAIGVCGLIKREGLTDADIGFALLPHFRAQGYAEEATRAVLKHAREVHNLSRLVAIATPNNLASIALLEKVGFRIERTMRLPSDPEELMLLSIAL